ncbi:MAG: type II secretion system protein [Ruminococcus sp.]|nr:type II secretion system protein [Ruminococcus sp.]
MNKNEGNRSRCGFTLVELVVVIAIIGILAVIIVPQLLNWVHKAQKKADIVSAKMIGTATAALITEDDEAYRSFYSPQSWTPRFYAKGSDGQVESYQCYIVGKLDGCTSKDGNKARPCKPQEWQPGEAGRSPLTGGNQVYFCQKLTEENMVRGGEKRGRNKDNYVMIPVRYRGAEDSPNTEATGGDRWLIVYRKNDPEKIEVWLADSSKLYSCQPVFRLWPDPDANFK